MSDARRVHAAVERIVGAGSPDVAAFMRRPQNRVPARRMGFGDDPHPSHVEATRQMLAACNRDRPARAVSALLSLDLTEGLP